MNFAEQKCSKQVVKIRIFYQDKEIEKMTKYKS